MRVLLTNTTLGIRGGSTLYLRDVAMELMRRGHSPVAYSTQLGPVAEELRAATVPVIDRLSDLGEAPDIIHGQHHYETLSALLHFPESPAIYYCHGWLPWEEWPLRHPNIIRYVAIDNVTRERLIVEGGIPSQKIELVLNFFDKRLFPPRKPLPDLPKRALAFGNDFDTVSVTALREACSRCGIELDACGLATGNATERPGDLLGSYDVVFAKGRAAIEAMAVGTSVVLCGYNKIGAMITPENFAALRHWNFGIRTLPQALTPERAALELQKYNPEEASRVSQCVRATCELQPALDQILQIYGKVVESGSRTGSGYHTDAARCAAEYLEYWANRYKTFSTAGAEREQWASRYHAAERLIAERDRQIRAQQVALEDRQHWIDRYHAAAEVIAERDREIREQHALIQDRQSWIERCAVAERAFCDLQADRTALEARCSATVDEKTRIENVLRQCYAETNHLRRELTQVRASATWRWSQRILKSQIVRLVFGGFIRSVAARSQAACEGLPAGKRVSPGAPTIEHASQETVIKIGDRRNCPQYAPISR